MSSRLNHQTNSRSKVHLKLAIAVHSDIKKVNFSDKMQTLNDFLNTKEIKDLMFQKFSLHFHCKCLKG